MKASENQPINPLEAKPLADEISTTPPEMLRSTAFRMQEMVARELSSRLADTVFNKALQGISQAAGEEGCTNCSGQCRGSCQGTCHNCTGDCSGTCKGDCAGSTGGKYSVAIGSDVFVQYFESILNSTIQAYTNVLLNYGYPL